MLNSIVVSLVFFLLVQVRHYFCQWLTKDAATWAVTEFEKEEKIRKGITFRGHDRRSAAPFISGDGFRHNCNHICEDHNRCRMDPAAVKDGECVFVKTDFFEFFVKDVVNRIPGKIIYA